MNLKGRLGMRVGITLENLPQYLRISLTIVAYFTSLVVRMYLRQQTGQVNFSCVRCWKNRALRKA
jgi:hypothetical protein